MMYTGNLPSGISVVLASASPRRRELLSGMGISFAVCPCDVDEYLPGIVPPPQAVVVLSERKARAASDAHPDALIIASDTLVACDGAALGKPVNTADAHRILMRLSGRAHMVYTGVTVLYRGRTYTARGETVVHMRPFGPEEADAYIATGEPMDKAGAYGIQGEGGRLVTHIEGAYDNVVGLPTELLARLLREALMEADE